MGRRPNLVLLGFMGTGKSAVGRRLAAATGRPLLEMDAEIERRAGKKIAAIFAEEGEGAFREMETALAREWGAEKEGAVISCGGGAALRPETLRHLGENGVLVCLTARPEAILERTGRSKDRPLLATEDREQKVRELLASRAEAYGRIANRVDTSDLTPQEVARRVLALWDGGMRAHGEGAV